MNGMGVKLKSGDAVAPSREKRSRNEASKHNWVRCSAYAETSGRNVFSVTKMPAQVQTHPCRLVGAVGRTQLERKTDRRTQKTMPCGFCRNSCGSLRSCPCSFVFFCRTEDSAKAFFQPGASVRPPQVSLLLSAGREGTTVFFNNIMSQWPECKQKQRKSPDLFASKTAVGCVRGPAPDGNAVTCCDGTRKKKLLFP